MDFACCAAVPGGGRNKEYALHLLHLCKGNVQVRFNHFFFFIIINIYQQIVWLSGSNVKVDATNAVSPTRTSFDEI